MATTEHNTAQFCRDFIHLFALLLLLVKTLWSKSILGISCKSQFLMALVLITRYFDVWYRHDAFSLFNELFKVTCLICIILTTLLVYGFGKKYQTNFDSFPIYWLILLPLALTFVLCREFTTLEMLWTYSVLLEAVALWPQFSMIYHMGEVQNMVFFYLLVLAIYKSFDISNSLHPYPYMCLYEPCPHHSYVDWVPSISGIFQLVPYLMFCAYKKIRLVHKANSRYAQDPSTANEQISISHITVPNDAEAKVTQCPLQEEK